MAAIDHAIAGIKHIKSTGVKVIDVDAILSYLEGMDKASRSVPAENNVSEAQVLKNLEIETQHDLAMFQSVLDAGKESLRASFIMTGGATVAIMTLLGNLEEKSLSKVGPEVSRGVLMLSLSTLLVVMSFGVRYVSQVWSAG